MGVEKADVGRDEPGVDALVVVDDGQVFAPRGRDAAVARMGKPLVRLAHHAQRKGRVARREVGEARLRIVLRVVVHHHALPQRERRVLRHDGLQRLQQRTRTVVGGDYERKPYHRVKVTISRAKKNKLSPKNLSEHQK